MPAVSNAKIRKAMFVGNIFLQHSCELQHFDHFSILYVLYVCIMDIWIYLCSIWVLNPTFRAVEVFIRDKYERKKYYDMEAVATAPVSISVTSCFYILSFGPSVHVIVRTVNRAAMVGGHFMNMLIICGLLQMFDVRLFDASICYRHKPTEM